MLPVILSILAGAFSGFPEFLLIHWLSFFSLEIVLAMRNQFELCYTLLLFAIIVIVFSLVYSGINISLIATALLTVLFIEYVSTENCIFVFLGDISFSLYAIHYPVSNFITKSWRYIFEGNIVESYSYFPAFLGSLIAGSIVWYFLERPSARWVKNIR